MSAPIELRFFYPRYQLSHLKQGMQNVRGLGGDMFLPPTLQYRYKMKITVGDRISLEWSEWQELPHVYEPIAEAIPAPSSPPEQP